MNMNFEVVQEKDKKIYNKTVGHPLQSFEWGEFREKTGVGVVREASFLEKKLSSGFTLTLHRVPKTKYFIGYLPKGSLPTKSELEEIARIGREHNCVFVQIEPNIVRRVLGVGSSEKQEQNTKEITDFEKLIHNFKFQVRNSFHPLFTKYNFVLDLTPSEEDLLASFHSKTRYNIRVAQKHEVRIEFDSSKKAFDEYLKLLVETTKRQGFYAHTPNYHRTLYETLSKGDSTDDLTYHIARANYTDTSGASHTLVAWVLFAFHDTLYYPYGASSNLYRFTMASNLIAWETIRYGKKLGLKKFDMWGALGGTPDTQDAWYGFHKFKSGYNPTHVEYVGSYDIIINPAVYKAYKAMDVLRSGYLNLRKRL